ncbi:MAG: HEPN domain-containing protein [Pseudomonadota bacterium]
MSPSSLIARAECAGASARALLKTGDVDGACNRAYYAMFHAARAALIASGSSFKPEVCKTHAGVLSAFNLNLVKNGPLTREFGSLLKQAEELRLTADYRENLVEASDAQEIVGQAESFVAALNLEFLSDHPAEAVPSMQP